MPSAAASARTPKRSLNSCIHATESVSYTSYEKMPSFMF